jgi:hypothetical protein
MAVETDGKSLASPVKHSALCGRLSFLAQPTRGNGTEREPGWQAAIAGWDIMAAMTRSRTWEAISPEDLFEQEIAEGAEIFFPLFPCCLPVRPWLYKSAPGKMAGVAGLEPAANR